MDEGGGERVFERPSGAAFKGSASGATVVRSYARDEKIAEFERAIVSFFIDAADVLGVPKSVAAIYGVCFASTEPLGFTEINDRLEISSGSISQGLRVLREVGALRVVILPLEKRERFEPDIELRRMISHFIKQRLDRQLDSSRGTLQAIVKQVPDSVASSEVLRTRIKTLEAWHDKARALLPLVKTFLKLT